MKPEYRNGGEGFCLWAEENVKIPIYLLGATNPTWTLIGELPDELHPETGRSYKGMWESQKEVFKEALRMEHGKFVHRLIVFCWARGDGKSFDACLIQLWKFFCFPRQQIVCGANSKEQTKFVHYDIMRDIILNSPKLLAAIGKKGVKEKEIVWKDRAGNPQSVIRCISSFSGIVSNITGYTFSEIFDMKNPKFFTQLDGSIRNIPNAIGVIDSTVSAKDHILYKLYETSVRDRGRPYDEQDDPTLFFSYRCSKEGDYRDYWHPMMTPAQLRAYKTKFLQADFERYFLNIWSAGGSKVFTQELVEAMGYLGIDHDLGSHDVMIDLLKKRNRLIEGIENIRGKESIGITTTAGIQEIEKRLWPLTEFYALQENGIPVPAPTISLKKLGDLFDTQWAVIAGMDRSDATLIKKSSARTMVAILAKGLRGSKSRPIFAKEGDNLPYIYFLLHLANIETLSLESIKNELDLAHTLYEIDAFGSERYGTWDLEQWCLSRNVKFEIWQQTYDRKKEMFNEFCVAVNQGRWKAPPLAIRGYQDNSGDILREEAMMFDHDPFSKLFGSPEKDRKHGVQDDAMYAIGACIYAGRSLSTIHFRERQGKIDFGVFIPPATQPLGKYVSA